MSSPNGSAPQLSNVFDPLTPWPAEVPASLTTDVVNGPSGQRLGLAIRIPNATVTVLLVKDDALKWADQIRSEVAKMNGLILPPHG